MTYSGKTVKNGDFLTKCQGVEKGDIWRFQEDLPVFKKTTCAVF
jgi:hypothetical protein